MADSGYRIDFGEINYYETPTGVKITTASTFLDVFKNMVDVIYDRPQLPITPTYQTLTSEDIIQYNVIIKNTTKLTLSYTSNHAAIHAIVYENKPAGVITTNVHDAVVTTIASLAPNTIGTYSFQSSSLPGVNLSQMKYLIIVDYRPPGSNGYHEMLITAHASKK